jgi:uncharacterized membrane protein YhiD involved in acid resistance
VIPEWLREGVHDPVVEVDSLKLAVRLTAAFVLGCVAAGVYRLTVRPQGPSTNSFLATLVLLSVLIALVTMVIGGNMARAFSLVGALAIVRFRTVVEETRDTAFVMYAVVVGMAAGAGFVEAAVAATPLVFLGAWLFRPAKTAPVVGQGLLVLRLGAARPPDEQVRVVLERHLGGGRLVGLSTARGGAALDVSYAVRLPAPEVAVALLSELSRIDGVQSVELKET